MNWESLASLLGLYMHLLLSIWCRRVGVDPSGVHNGGDSELVCVPNLELAIWDETADGYCLAPPSGRSRVVGAILGCIWVDEQAEKGTS